MSATITKSLILSQPKSGQNSEVAPPTLPHTTVQEDNFTVTSIEIPGVDPSTVGVNCKDNSLHVTCEKGSVTLPLVPTSDVTKIEASILWGMLTVRIPVAEPPPERTIKVSLLDVVKKAPPKTKHEEFTEDEKG
jgi:HSP20 family molecular chaperone IbpA